MHSSEILLINAKEQLNLAKKAQDKYYLLDRLSLLKSFLNDYPDFELYEKVVNLSENISVKLAKKNSRINPEIRKMLKQIEL